MRRYTQKELRELVRLGMAADITQYSFDQANALYKHGITKIGYSSGVYGCNGALFQDDHTGEYYAITCRNTTLAQLA